MSIAAGVRPGAPGQPARTLGRSPAALLLLATLLAVVGCTTALPTDRPGDASPGRSSPGDSTSPDAIASPTVSAPPSVASPIPVDRTLLDVLPAAIDGSPMLAAAELEGRAGDDPGLASAAERAAAGLVASGSRPDWAIAWVVALRAGAWDDAAYRSWRASYDLGVCTSQGGPAGHAEAVSGGRTVYITTCGALVVHHARLSAPDRIVAVTSVGAGRWGERLIAGLRP